MTREAHHLRTDLSLRAGGLLSLGTAAITIHMLAGLHPIAGGLAFLLAMIGFLGSSAGATLLLLGRHIHDPVRVSARWRRIDRRDAR